MLAVPYIIQLRQQHHNHLNLTQLVVPANLASSAPKYGPAVKPEAPNPFATRIPSKLGSGPITGKNPGVNGLNPTRFKHCSIF